jgi:hypothetical protein
MSRIVLALGLGLGLGLIGVSACGELLAPIELAEHFELPEPDTSLDPSRLRVGELIATPCAFQKAGDGLAHLRGRAEWAVVDVHFGRMSPAGPWGAPTSSDLDLVRAHGGRVLHSFNVPAVRTHILLSRVPDLVANGDWITVRDVPDATRYDVPLTVGFGRALGDADTDRFVRLGGHITRRFDFINALAGMLPDRSIGVLWDDPDVEFIQAESVACLAGG